MFYYYLLLRGHLIFSTRLISDFFNSLKNFIVKNFIIKILTKIKITIKIKTFRNINLLESNL